MFFCRRAQSARNWKIEDRRTDEVAGADRCGREGWSHRLQSESPRGEDEWRRAYLVGNESNDVGLWGNTESRRQTKSRAVLDAGQTAEREPGNEPRRAINNYGKALALGVGVG